MTGANTNTGPKKRRNTEKIKQKGFKPNGRQRHDGFGRLVPPALMRNSFGPPGFHAPRQGRYLPGPMFRPPHIGFPGPLGGFNPRLRGPPRPLGPPRPPPPFMQRPPYQRDFLMSPRQVPLLPNPRPQTNFTQNRHNRNNNNKTSQISANTTTLQGDGVDLMQSWVRDQMFVEQQRCKHLLQVAKRTRRPCDWHEVRDSKKRSALMMKAIQERERLLPQQPVKNFGATQSNPELDPKAVDFTEDLKF